MNKFFSELGVLVKDAFFDWPFGSIWAVFMACTLLFALYLAIRVVIPAAWRVFMSR
jgi:hypothetical protein